jgi:hypothetical protein
MNWYHKDLGFLRGSANFSLNGNNYPENWLDRTDTESRQKLGFFPVSREALPDSKFYDVIGETVEIVDGVAKVSLQIVPHDLSKLKAKFCQEIKITAGLLIGQSGADWMAARAEQHRQLRENQLLAGVTPEDAVELKPVPETVLGYAHSVRKASDLAEQAVMACKTVKELAGLPPVVWPQQ